VLTLESWCYIIEEHDKEQFEDVSETISSVFTDYINSLSAQDDIKRQLEDLSGRISVILADYINNLSKQFEGVQKRISDNLKKLRIGVIHSTIDKIIEKILEEELGNVKHDFQIKFNDFIDVMSDGIVVPKLKKMDTGVKKPAISKPKVKTLDKPQIPKPKVLSLEKPKVPKSKSSEDKK